MFPCRGGRHFGEAAAQCERMCDCCARGGTAAVDRRNVSGAAAGVARTLADWASAEKRATLLQLVDAWRGSKARLAKKTLEYKETFADSQGSIHGEVLPGRRWAVEYCTGGRYPDMRL